MKHGFLAAVVAAAQWAPVSAEEAPEEEGKRDEQRGEAKGGAGAAGRTARAL